MEYDVETIIVALALLILLAVASMRFGADSRDGFPSKERDLASRGLIWPIVPAARDRSSGAEPRAPRQLRPAVGQPPAARAA
jgi:hypothetical protein